MVRGPVRKKTFTLSQREEKQRGKNNVRGGHDRQGASDQVMRGGAGLFCLERHLSINNQWPASANCFFQSIHTCYLYTLIKLCSVKQIGTFSSLKTRPKSRIIILSPLWMKSDFRVMHALHMDPVQWALFILKNPKLLNHLQSKTYPVHGAMTKLIKPIW